MKSFKVNPIDFLIALFLCNVDFAMANENCTSQKRLSVCQTEIVKAQVDFACKLLQEKGRKALAEINNLRYECCGDPNFIWVSDLTPKMILHPLKPNLNGKSLAKEADAAGKFFVNEFVKATKNNPNGVFVNYKWTRFGDTKPTEKTEWVRRCKVGSESETWLVGSGTWK